MTQTSNPQPNANPHAPPSGYTRVDNTIFDQLMPTLSGNGLKILLIALRQTSGWADESSPTGRKLFDEISYSQFLAKSGIVSKSTLSRAIQECLAAGYLIRRRNGRGYLYSLNAASKINGPETVPSTSPETGPPTVQNLDTQKKGSNKHSGGGDCSFIFSLLRDFGMNQDEEVKALTARYSLQQIEYGVSRARQQAKRNPPGLLRAWMRAGNMPLPPPKERKHETDNRRYHELNDDAQAFRHHQAAKRADQA